jgi:hypothetical protein
VNGSCFRRRPSCHLVVFRRSPNAAFGYIPARVMLPSTTSLLCGNEMPHHGQSALKSASSLTTTSTNGKCDGIRKRTKSEFENEPARRECMRAMQSRPSINNNVAGDALLSRWRWIIILVVLAATRKLVFTWSYHYLHTRLWYEVLPVRSYANAQM